MNNREYLAANPEKLAEVAAKGVCDCCAYRDAVPCGDCDEGVGKWLVQEHQPETFHDDFYDCESTVGVPSDPGAAAIACVDKFVKAHTEHDTQEKLDGDLRGLLTLLVDDAARTEREGLLNKHAKVDMWWNPFVSMMERQAAITEREGRANQRAEQILAQNAKLRKNLDAMIGCPGYDAPSHRCRYHDQDFELNDRTVNALKRENAALQKQIDRILKAPKLSDGVNMQLVEGVEALNERVSELEAENMQYDRMCQTWEELFHSVRDQRNAMRDRLAELEEGEGHE